MLDPQGSRLGILVSLAALLGCAKVKSLLGQDGDPAPASSAPVVAASAAAQEPGDDAVCTSSDRKVWGKWANRRAGLTPTKIGDRVAVGVAFGNRPAVVVFDAAGGGRLVQLGIPAGSPLAKDLRAPDRRDLQRVTPARADGGGITAYADYRDKYQSGRRRIACGSVESTRSVLVFDGRPLLDPDQPQAKKEPDQKPDAGATTGPLRGLPRLKLPRAPLGATPAPPPAAAAAPDAAAPAPPPVKAADKPRTELRDCRTFVDANGSVWAVGSELRGEPRDDGSTSWSMRFFAAPDAGRGYVTLHSAALPKEPKTLHTFESPVSAELGGAHIVLARYQGSLFGWSLGGGFRPNGGMRVYRGGYPTMPHLIRDGAGLVLLTSQKTQGEAYELFWTQLSGTRLPASLSKLEIDGADGSFAEPTLARAGEQNWLSYQAGARREGRLVVLPVDGQLRAAGKPHDVTSGGTTVYESHLFALDEGKLLALYIQNAEPGAELVSEVLTCSVRK
jgi:hypothetical protein